MSKDEKISESVGYSTQDIEEKTHICQKCEGAGIIEVEECITRGEQLDASHKYRMVRKDCHVCKGGRKITKVHDDVYTYQQAELGILKAIFKWTSKF